MPETLRSTPGMLIFAKTHRQRVTGDMSHPKATLFHAHVAHLILLRCVVILSEQLAAHSRQFDGSWPRIFNSAGF
jgi:hypothetical protein